jgi:hypothetical protein
VVLDVLRGEQPTGGGRATDAEGDHGERRDERDDSRVGQWQNPPPSHREPALASVEVQRAIATVERSIAAIASRDSASD